MQKPSKGHQAREAKKQRKRQTAKVRRARRKERSDRLMLTKVRAFLDQIKSLSEIITIQEKEIKELKSPKPADEAANV